MCAGKVLNYAGVSVLTPAEMSASARRVLRFIDLGGHEKFLKTALYGMTCMVSVAAMCIFGASCAAYALLKAEACGCLSVAKDTLAAVCLCVVIVTTIRRVMAVLCKVVIVCCCQYSLDDVIVAI